jgi:hypothetical protein
MKRKNLVHIAVPRGYVKVICIRRIKGRVACAETKVSEKIFDHGDLEHIALIIFSELRFLLEKLPR